MNLKSLTIPTLPPSSHPPPPLLSCPPLFSLHPHLPPATSHTHTPQTDQEPATPIDLSEKYVSLSCFPCALRSSCAQCKEEFLQGRHRDAHQPRWNDQHFVWSDFLRGYHMAGRTEDAGMCFTWHMARRRARTHKDSHQSTTCQQTGRTWTWFRRTRLWPSCLLKPQQ